MILKEFEPVAIDVRTEKSFWSSMGAFRWPKRWFKKAFKGN